MFCAVTSTVITNRLVQSSEISPRPPVLSPPGHSLNTKYQTLGYATKASSETLFSTLAKLVEDIKNSPDFTSFKEEMLNESNCENMTRIVYLPIAEENVS